MTVKLTWMNSLRLIQLATPALLGLVLGAAALADEPIVIPQAWKAREGDAAINGKPPEAPPAAAHTEEPGMAAWHQRHDEYFKRSWGIAVRGVKRIASGYMLEFKYEVLDAGKAAPLNEKRSKAFVIDQATDTRLSVPAMENIGELRQAPKPEENRLYYIIFGNPGKLVPKGGRVDVVIGRFRADGVIVD
jgi:hypothetical protein